MRKFTLMTICAALVGLTTMANAQVGSGWKQQSYSERLEYHHSGGPEIQTISPAPSSFSDSYISYSNKSGVRTFTFKNTTAGRCEIRVNNDYTSGQHQFQGDLTFSKPTSMLSDYNDTIVAQDFGAATHAAWKLECNKASGGSLTAEGTTIMTSAYNKTIRVNIIHDMSTHRIQVYLNGSKKYDQADQGGTSHYSKFGMYGGHVVTKDTWTNVKYFTK